MAKIVSGYSRPSKARSRAILPETAWSRQPTLASVVDMGTLSGSPRCTRPGSSSSGISQKAWVEETEPDDSNIPMSPESSPTRYLSNRDWSFGSSAAETTNVP